MIGMAAPFPYASVGILGQVGLERVLPILNFVLVLGVGLLLLVTVSRASRVNVSIALVENLTHAMIITATIIAVCLLALEGHASDTTVATVLGAAIGYAAGKGGATAIQTHDPGQQ